MIGKALTWIASYRPLRLSTHSFSNPIYISHFPHLCFACNTSHPYNKMGYCILSLLLKSLSLHGEPRCRCHSTKYEGRQFNRIMLDTWARGSPPNGQSLYQQGLCLGIALETGCSGPGPCWGVCQQFNNTGQLHTSVQKSVVACADIAF